MRLLHYWTLSGSRSVCHTRCTLPPQSSTMAVVFPAAAGELWSEMKANTSETSWFILSIDPEDKKRLDVTAQGRCGLEHMRRFLDDTQIQFGAFRIQALSATHKTPRFCLFTFKGSKAPLKVKAAAGNIASPFVKFFEGAHHEFEFNGLDTITNETVIAKLSSAGGSFKPTGYEFGTGNPADLEYDEILAKEQEDARIVEETRVREEEEARIAAEVAAAEEIRRAAEAERQRRLNMLPPRLAGDTKRHAREASHDGFDLSELTSRFILESFNNVEDELSWVVVHVTEDAPKKFTLSGSGSGGLDEMAAVLSKDDIQYGAFRVAAIERKGARLSIRPKLVTFVWNGSEVTTKTKLRNNGVIKAFSVYFAKPTIEFQVNGDAADFAPDRISARLRSCVPASEFRFGVYDRDAQADDYIAQLAAIGITDAKAAEEAARAAHAGAGRE